MYNDHIKYYLFWFFKTQNGWSDVKGGLFINFSAITITSKEIDSVRVFENRVSGMDYKQCVQRHLNVLNFINDELRILNCEMSRFMNLTEDCERRRQQKRTGT